MLEEARLDTQEASLLSPLQLAYMGDAVWECLVRGRLMQQRLNVRHMHAECVRRVNAGAQANALKQIRSRLTETESAIVLRGRNAHPKHPSPRHQDPGDYAEATGFEALVGYLYLTGQEERIREIRDIILEENESNG